MPTARKQSIVEELRETLRNSSGLVVISFSGLSVPMMTALRAKLRQAGAVMKVAKNRLVRLAIAGTEAEQLSETLSGPNAFVFCQRDVPPVVKALADFRRESGGIELRASFLEGSLYDRSQTEALAAIPSRAELLSEIVGALESPISGLVFTLQGIINDFVYTLEAVADKLEKEAA